MSVINTNYLALVSQNNLTKSQNSLGTAIERLSSGLRINSAKDDAAGQAIANRFTANIKGLSQAARNANDGISIAQTTEGALNEINNNLQRIRELSVQAATGSNSASDLDSIQAEIQQRLDEIDRVSAQTQFNGVHVLAQQNSLTVQVGAHDNQTISVNLQQINADTLGLGSFNIAQPKLDLTTVGAATTEVQAGGPVTVNLTAKDSNVAGAWEVYVDDASADDLYVSNDGGTTFYAVTGYDNATGQLQFDSSGTTVAATATAATAGQALSIDGESIVVDNVGYADANPGATNEIFVDPTGNFHVKQGSNYYAATANLTTGEVSFDSSGASTTTAPSGLSGDAITAYERLDPAVNANLAAVTGQLGANATLHAVTGGGYVVKGEVDGKTAYFKAEVAANGTVTLAEDENGEQVQYNTELKPLAALDKALQQVDSLRSELGAVQNRFQSTIANLTNTVNNLSAARSRIEDADYAVEVSNMTRAQILQQAGTSVLAQANQVPQTVLSLLR